MTSIGGLQTRCKAVIVNNCGALASLLLVHPLIFRSMRRLFICIALFGAFAASAQDHTRNFYYDLSSGVKARVAVMPFEPRMLISDLHREMCQRNGMTTREVREALAEGFFYSMRRHAPPLTEPDVFGWNDPWPSALEAIYRQIGYKYEPIPELTGQAAEVHGAYVEGGELKQQRDTVTRFMEATVKKPLLKQMAEETGSDYVLMVSQLDIVNLGTPMQVNPDGAEFFVRVHYSFYDAKGDKLTSGLVRRPLIADSYDPVEFSRAQFGDAARALYDALTIAVEEEQTDETATEEQGGAQTR